VVPRRNSRGGRSAAEHLIAALRCMYKHAEEDGLINPADNPARKVDKPRRLLAPDGKQGHGAGPAPGGELAQVERVRLSCQAAVSGQ
jgi:hypothetical protein